MPKPCGPTGSSGTSNEVGAHAEDRPGPLIIDQFFSASCSSSVRLGAAAATPSAAAGEAALVVSVTVVVVPPTVVVVVVVVGILAW